MAAALQRDLFIDYAKGLATLSVIFIHATFWSGQFYVPTEMRVLSLIFDVPLFFALSGITSGNNIEKTFYRLLKLQVTYMIFVTFLFFADYFFKVFGLIFFTMDDLIHFYSTFGSKFVPSYISDNPDWGVLFNWYIHNYIKCDTFPVVMGSFWYLKVYYIITVFGVLILKFFPKHLLWFTALCFGLTLFYNLVPGYFPSGQVPYVSIYLGVFLLGHLIRGKKLSLKWVVSLYVLFFIGLIILVQSLGIDAFMKMNKSKFPPKLLYIFWISFSLITLFALYNRWKIKKNNFVTYIGQHAIFFYFAQGISSSLIYFLVVPLEESMHWSLLLIFIFIVNVFLAFIIVKLLMKVDTIGWKVLEYVRKKTEISPN